MKATLLSTPATLLSTPTGPLTAGLYVAESQTPGYDMLMASVVADEAKLEGERFGPDGRKIITVRVTGPKRNPPGEPEARKVSIGREFFVTALKDYHDWPQKWWREAVQNSVDGGAKSIALRSRENADGTWTVSCEDDGRGMDEDTLLNKFLVLGGTSKQGVAGAAGGFGKAKELLILPWIGWKIHTRDRVAEGAGIDYTVREAPMRQGTYIECVMPADCHTYDAPAMAFLGKSFLPSIDVTVDGKPFNSWLAEGNPLKGARSMPGVARFTFAPTSGSSSIYLLVRVRGIMMFEEYLTYASGGGGYLICEVEAPSVTVLTANRDGFRDPQLKRHVSELSSEVAKDVRSALREARGQFKKVYEGDPALRYRAKAEEATAMELIGPVAVGGAAAEAALQSVAAVVDGYRRQADAQSTAEPAVIETPSSEVVDEMLHAVKGSGQTTLEAAVKQLFWKPDFLVINEMEGYKVPKKLLPEGMTPKVARLARVWAELCRYVLIQLACDKPYGVGFIFDTNTGAAFQPDPDRFGRGSGWLVLNPHRDYRNVKDLWVPTKDADLKWLYALAVHEATHMADGIEYHDEEFASAMTHNMAKCAAGFQRAKKIVAGIKLRDVGGKRAPRAPRRWRRGDPPPPRVIEVWRRTQDRTEAASELMTLSSLDAYQAYDQVRDWDFDGKLG